jgi:hypothetical protein
MGIMKPSIPYCPTAGFIISLGHAEMQAWQAVQLFLICNIDLPPGGTIPAGKLPSAISFSPNAGFDFPPVAFAITETAAADAIPVPSAISVFLNAGSAGFSPPETSLPSVGTFLFLLPQVNLNAKASDVQESAQSKQTTQRE